MPRLEALRKELSQFRPTPPPGGGGATPASWSHTPREDPNKVVHLATYGCQQNVADTEVVRSLLQASGYGFSDDPDAADIVLLNTCAIRDNAEARVWRRLRALRDKSMSRTASRALRARRVGLLGCMAERLKEDLLSGDDPLVDLVVGPDAYRDLPRLLEVADDRGDAINVALSVDETYADVAPVREDPQGKAAFVSIMRGCNNMCAFCIVPRTRGRERSRPMGSILAEVAALADQGVREITLLGQNVNSYQDLTSEPHPEFEARQTSAGFSPFIKRNEGGVRFAELLEKVAHTAPNTRIRYTSPHPQHFPLQLLQVMGDNANVCNSIHLPAQSGSDSVLASMRRGYTFDSYMQLVETIRETLPGVHLSSDFISGFCGESDDDHARTLDLIRAAKYSKAYMFAYSMRERTHAHRKLVDDVPEDVKQARLSQVIQTFQETAKDLHATELGTDHVVLVDAPSKRSSTGLIGRTDSNLTVAFDAQGTGAGIGDFVRVKITGTGSHTQQASFIQLQDTPHL